MRLAIAVGADQAGVLEPAPQQGAQQVPHLQRDLAGEKPGQAK